MSEGEREKQPREPILLPPLSMDEEGPSMTGAALYGEKTPLPLAGKQNHGGTTAPPSLLYTTRAPCSTGR
jgi:hypothetical protein